MQIISTFYKGNFQQKAPIINIVLRLRMSAFAYAYVKVWTSPFLITQVTQREQTWLNDVLSEQTVIAVVFVEQTGSRRSVFGGVARISEKK